jgi:hypothetical protein
MSKASIPQNVIDYISSHEPDFERTKQFRRKTLVAAYEQAGIRLTSNVFEILQSVDRGIWGLPKGFKAGEPIVDQVKPKKIRTSRPAEPIPDVAFIAQTQGVVAANFDTKVSRNNTFSEVPALDPNYVPFGNYKHIEKVLKSRRFYPMFITGHSGNGKSSQINHICAKHGIPLIRMNCTKHTDEEKLIGTKTLVDGNVVVVEGPVLTGMRSGSVILLDELDAADANGIMCLQGLLEGRPFYFALTGEWITPQPGFNIVATANTKGKGSDDGRYIGTNIMNEAFLERFPVTFEQEYPTPAIEKKMVMNWMSREECVDETFAEDLVKWADAIRRTYRDGAIDELITSRRLEHIVGAFAIYGDKLEAIELCTNRFDVLTKEAFKELFTKISAEEVKTPIAEAA